MSFQESSATPRPVEKFTIVDLEEVADCLAESHILDSADLGTTLVHKVEHKTRGTLLIINTAGNKHIVLPI